MNLAGLIRLSVRILTILSSALALCVFIALIYGEPVNSFIITAIVAGVFAAVGYYFSEKSNSDTFSKKEAYLSVSIAWFLMSVIGALPYVLSGYFPSYIDAFFESVSGFTTTGSSILTDIEVLPKSILFWRSFTHWIGGIGIIVLVIVIMPSAKINNYSIFSLESTVRDKVKPRIRSVGYRLLGIYILLTFTEVVLLLFGNMSLYESVCHAFGTVSTGGFSPKNTSLINYSPYIQYVVMIFMILGGTNFILHYFAIKRQFKPIKENEEFRFYISAIVIAGLFITLILYFQTDRSFEASFRDSFFQVASIITCTGFATSDYLLWPNLGWIMIFLLMFLGGSTGSTAGGIKIARHVIAIKSVKNIFVNQLHPHSIRTTHLNGKLINTEANISIISYIYWYLLAFLAGSISLVLMGLDGMTSTSAIATAMGGIGPGFGTIGPVSNFAHLPDAAKILLSVFMILGRLELYTIIILFTPSFWKK